MKRWVKEKEPERAARETGIMDFLDAFMIVATVSLIFIVCTLEYLINVQAGKISKINKRAGGNRVVQVGIFQKSIVKKL